MNKRIALLIVFLLQALFLGAMVSFHQLKLKSATKILLKTEPIDPFSMFRGRYVSLRYEINSLPAALLEGYPLNKLKDGVFLYVLLKNEDGYWQAKAIFKDRPKNKEVYLRGTLRNFYNYANSSKFMEYAEPKDQERKLYIDYGIESFFLDEARAKEMDNLNRPRLSSWDEREKARKKRISELDPETQRVSNAHLSKYWLEGLLKEMSVWVKEGLISAQAQENITSRYSAALNKLEAIDQDLGFSLNTRNQKQIFVEVAVDKNCVGYPVRIIVEGKEYK